MKNLLIVLLIILCVGVYSNAYGHGGRLAADG